MSSGLTINKIYNENCLDTMSKMEDNFVDLVVTSPPYDNLRTYNGYSFDFEKIAKELYRVVKLGGIVVWIVGDATIKGSETGTSFRQALYFKECGFNLHDTMIWDKNQFSNPGAYNLRYSSVFDYMFVFSKARPKTFNPIKDKKNKYAGDFVSGTTIEKDGSRRIMSGHKIRKIKEIGQRYNIWKISSCRKSKLMHPARFPEQLANDHIISWSNEGDLVYDPFIGSGTTGKMAILNNRNYIGSEISNEYCEIANKRIESGTKYRIRKLI